jgi:hypothetical protein
VVTLMEPVVASTPTPECSGTPEAADAPAVAVVVAGRPARLWSTGRRPTLGMWPLAPATAGPGHLVCVPLAGGGSLRTAVTGTADTAGDAVRVAGSVRAAGPAEVAVPFSLEVAVFAVAVRADDAGTGRWTGQLAAPGGTVVELGRPDPTSPPPNPPVGGRPAHLKSSPTKGTFLTMPLGPDLAARLIGEFRDTTLAAATGLQVGATPDYSWFYR